MVKLLYIDNFAALALSQAETDESLTRMLRRLETAGVVARAEPSSDALLGFDLVESGTCWRPSPKKFWRIALAIREQAFGRCRRTGPRASRVSVQTTPEGRKLSLNCLHQSRSRDPNPTFPFSQFRRG